MLMLVLLGGFVILILVGAPISLSLGVSSVMALIVKGSIPMVTVLQVMLTPLDSFPYLAVPLFILAGGLMETGGISLRLIRFASVLVGWIRGGLGLTTIVGTLLFSDISGSSAADTAAIGGIAIPAMRRKGYPVELATVIVAASGSAAVLVPPCITMVIYGFVTGTSIAALFAAGLLPGILMGLSIMVWTFFLARRLDLPADPFPTLGEVVRATWGVLLPMCMPVIILGGILGGIFTVTESAVVAVIFGFIVSVGIYKEMKLQQIPKIILDTASTTGIVMLLAACASIFAWIVAAENVPGMIGAQITQMSNRPFVFLIITNIILLILGTMMDSAAAILIMMPILFPIAMRMGIDPVHYGIIATANLGVGFITPPVGACLFVACSISNLPIDRVVKPLIPYILSLIGALMLITYVPYFVLLLPRVLLGYAR